MSTPARYFSLFDDMQSGNRWFLQAPTAPNGAWLSDALSCARPFKGETPLKVEISRSGPPLELTITTTDMVLLVNERVARILQRVAPGDFELIPARVGDLPDPYFVVNTLSEPDCVDDQRSVEVVRWTEADHRPDRTGRYRSISVLQIDPARTEGRKIFRPWGWFVEIIVEGSVADELRRENVRCDLTPVT